MQKFYGAVIFWWAVCRCQIGTCFEEFFSKFIYLQRHWHRASLNQYTVRVPVLLYEYHSKQSSLHTGSILFEGHGQLMRELVGKRKSSSLFSFGQVFSSLLASLCGPCAFNLFVTNLMLTSLCGPCAAKLFVTYPSERHRRLKCKLFVTNLIGP